ncbi:hypothetical protein H9P43_009797 [Blastocladiella emersonii ATCC 22665]|nr:hypothetical protein H9P43_009797 [Blastocladiella emersonii ATCC 22665]
MDCATCLETCDSLVCGRCRHIDLAHHQKRLAQIQASITRQRALAQAAVAKAAGVAAASTAAGAPPPDTNAAAPSPARRGSSRVQQIATALAPTNRVADVRARVESLRALRDSRAARVTQVKAEIHATRTASRQRRAALHTAQADSRAARTKHSALVGQQIRAAKAQLALVTESNTSARRILVTTVLAIFGLAPNTPKPYTIHGLPVPGDLDFHAVDPRAANTALGHLVHLVNLLAVYTHAPLPYDLVFRLSACVVDAHFLPSRDPSHPFLPPSPNDLADRSEFPLAVDNVDAKEMGIALSMLYFQLASLAATYGVAPRTKRIRVTSGPDSTAAAGKGAPAAAAAAPTKRVLAELDPLALLVALGRAICTADPHAPVAPTTPPSFRAIFRRITRRIYKQDADLGFGIIDAYSGLDGTSARRAGSAPNVAGGEGGVGGEDGARAVNHHHPLTETGILVMPPPTSGAASSSSSARARAAAAGYPPSSSVAQRRFRPAAMDATMVADSVRFDRLDDNDDDDDDDDDDDEELAAAYGESDSDDDLPPNNATRAANSRKSPGSARAPLDPYSLVESVARLSIRDGPQQQQPSVARSTLSSESLLTLRDGWPPSRDSLELINPGAPVLGESRAASNAQLAPAPAPTAPAPQPVPDGDDDEWELDFDAAPPAAGETAGMVLPSPLDRLRNRSARSSGGAMRRRHAAGSGSSDALAPPQPPLDPLADGAVAMMASVSHLPWLPPEPEPDPVVRAAADPVPAAARPPASAYYTDPLAQQQPELLSSLWDWGKRVVRASLSTAAAAAAVAATVPAPPPPAQAPRAPATAGAEYRVISRDDFRSAMSDAARAPRVQVPPPPPASASSSAATTRAPRRGSAPTALSRPTRLVTSTLEGDAPLAGPRTAR